MRTIYYPTDYTAANDALRPRVYTKFLRPTNKKRKGRDDGVSFDAAGIGHGRRIRCRVLERFWNKRCDPKVKEHEWPRKILFFEFDPQWLLDLGTEYPELRQTLGEPLFHFLDDNDPVHVMLCLPDGVEPVENKDNIIIGLTFNGKELLGRTQTAKLLYQLENGFESGRKTYNDTKDRYFRDCKRSDSGFRCPRWCPPAGSHRNTPNP